MSGLPAEFGIPGHFFKCEFNRLAYDLYMAQLVVGFFKAPIQRAAQIVAGFLTYFNYLNLVIATHDEWTFDRLPAIPPGSMCEIPLLNLGS